jgi:hypothetical protein
LAFLVQHSQRFHTLGVMRGHSRPKDGVASLAYDPRIHEAVQPPKPYGSHTLRFIMDCRVKPGNDARRG